MPTLAAIKQRKQERAAKAQFATQLAALLSLATVVLLGLLALLYSSDNPATDQGEGSTLSDRWLEQGELRDDNNNNNDDATAEPSDFTTYSCHYIYEVAPYAGEKQCAFARQCNLGKGVWAPFVFCHNSWLSTNAWAALLSPVILLWTVLLFRMLASTAEDFFSPALEMFSVKLGLPPRFAGVSLLALGNGAADVSATVSAITTDPHRGYELALGALTGAAMFISSVVSAVVVLAADGVPCRGALVRDVTMLCLTVLAVWWQLSDGTVGADTMSLFLSMYFVFVVLVLVADIYHRAVVVPRLNTQAQEQERSRQIAEAERVNNNGFSAAITALSNYDNVNPASPSRGGWGVEADDLAQERPIVLHGRDGILRPPPGAPVTSTAEADDDSGAYRMLDTAVDRVCVEPGSLGIPAADWQDAIANGQKELLEHAQNVWEDIVWNEDLHVASKFLLLCELPFTTLRKITVPIPCEGYYVRALVALSLALSPLWFAYYLGAGHHTNLFSNGGWLFFLLVEVAMCCASLCILRCAPGGEGNMAIAVSAPIGLYGFLIAATWIDSIADALVSVLNFVGIILRIPGPVIGLTILAWGNSCGDLSANVTMARKGLGNMAMTACFAGPVFNILVGLGLGFGSLAAKTGNVTTEVSLSPSVVTGFVFLALSTILFLVVGLVFGKGRIFKSYGYIALTVYSIYLITALSVQYKSSS